MKSKNLHWLSAYYKKFTTLRKRHHAYLFSGHIGLGKTQLSSDLAAFLLEVDDAEGHPDFYKVCLLEEKKAISIEQIRQMQEKMSLSCHSQKQRVIQVLDAEKMTLAAANALLKFLEEPPPHLTLLLTSSERSRLPATILSRCQLWSIPSPNKKEIETWLKSLDTGANKREVSIATGWCSESPLNALDFLKRKDKKELIALMEFLRKDQLDGHLSLIDSWIKKGWEELIYVFILKQINLWINKNVYFKTPQLRRTLLLQKDIMFCFQLTNSNIRKNLLLQSLLTNWSCWKRKQPFSPIFDSGFQGEM